jgi:predicted lipid-binding transport protein (Tim44 family)
MIAAIGGTPAPQTSKEDRDMKALLLTLLVGAASLALAPTDADARRLGGGGMSGMQRSLPARAPVTATPPKTTPAPAATAAAPATPAPAAAAAPRRSWLGPIAGLAAGLGIAALMSHLGFGAEFGNIIMMVLLGLVAIVAVRFLLRRFGPSQAASPALATPGGLPFSGRTEPWSGAATPPLAPATPSTLPSAGGMLPLGAGATSAFASPATATAEPGAKTLPADFDTAAFERIAKMIFIRMQAANDAGDLDDLRAFTTPEMFASARLDLQERGSLRQTTDVVRIDAEVLDLEREADRQVVSVRFHGLIREELNGGAQPFDEVWHLVRPNDGSREWAIAGIQQMA